MKYTYSDDEDFMTDSTSARRSNRNTRPHSPIEPSGPVVTASGRQVRRPDRMTAEGTAMDGRSVSGSVKDEHDDSQATGGPRGRPQRSAAAHHGMNGWAAKKRKSEEYESDSDEEGSEPDYGGDDEEEHVPDETDEDAEEFDYEAMDEDELDDGPEPSLVVKLRARVGIDNLTGKVYRMPNRPASATAPPASPPASKSPESSGSTVQSSSSPRSPPQPAAADVISVALKQRNPEPVMEALQPLPQPQNHPSTPGNGPAVTAALAFRGSPEKPQHVAPQVGLGYIE
jgi:hypothetical protein